MKIKLRERDGSLRVLYLSRSKWKTMEIKLNSLLLESDESSQYFELDGNYTKKSKIPYDEGFVRRLIEDAHRRYNKVNKAGGDD